MSMISTERETLQRLYERMSIQAEQNVRGSLQKSKEWEENARLHAKNSLEKLLELQKRAEERTRELVERQSSSVRCVECETAAASEGHEASYHEEHHVESGSEVQPAENAESHSGSEVHAESEHRVESEHHEHVEGAAPAAEGSYRREEHHEVHDESNLNADSNVETTTTITEWSTVLSEHSSTIIE